MLSSQTLFICLYPGHSFLLLEDSAPISEDSYPRTPGAYPAVNHRTATNHFNPNVSFFTTEAIHFSRDGWTCQLHSPAATNLLQGMLPLAKCSFLLPCTPYFPSTHLLYSTTVGCPGGNIPCSTVSQIPLLSCSIHWLEIQKGAKKNLHMPGKFL